MKKSIKFISLFILSLVMIVLGKENVFAADLSPSTFTATSYKMTSKPLGLGAYNISVKKTSTGRYIYCYDVNDDVPNNIKYTKGSLVTDPVINYIIANGSADKTDTDFFATQAALWIYLYDSGKMQDTQYKYIADIKSKINSSTYGNTAVAKDIKQILSDAKNYGSYYLKKVDITTNSVTFTLKNGYYVSNTIKVNKLEKHYLASVTNAPKNTKITESDYGFVISIPESSVAEGTTNFSIKVQSYMWNTYKYTPASANYQEMLVTYADVLEDSINASITKEKKVVEKELTTVYVTKKDADTNKALAGATLVVKDLKGTVIDKWVSTTTAHKVEGLEEGTYVLSELYAPSGYTKTSETIKFTVKKDGEVKYYTIENEPKEIEERPPIIVIPEEPKDLTVIYVSKKDITNSEELPGATLVVKNSKGEIIDKWISTDEVHYVKNLEKGTYTLTETIAPEGYVLSTETITFEVKEDGKIRTVTMYNSPEEVEETIVKISKKDITNDEELPGATLIIKDSTGKELYKWESTNEAYIIKGLEEGTYTLEETIAPEGYVLNKEIITFEVKNNGEVTEVVMYNTPEVTEVIEVPDTGSFTSNLTYVIGGLVILIGSVLIYRNAKKEQEQL